MQERRKSPRRLIRLPLECWETDDTCHGGIVGNLSEGGLLLHFLGKIPVGNELNIGIFFANGYEFDSIRVTGIIVWKDYHHETEWIGHEYGIKFIHISEEDRQKLITLLRSPSTVEEFHTTEGTETKNAPSEEPVSSSIPDLNSQPMKEMNRHCLWDRFKTKVLHLQ